MPSKQTTGKLAKYLGLEIQVSGEIDKDTRAELERKLKKQISENESLNGSLPHHLDVHLYKLTFHIRPRHFFGRDTSKLKGWKTGLMR